MGHTDGTKLDFGKKKFLKIKIVFTNIFLNA